MGNWFKKNFLRKKRSFCLLSKNGKVFFLILILLFAPLYLTFAATENKTVKFFIGQDSALRSSGEQISFPFTITIPESSPVVQSAWIEIQGVSFNNSGWQIINVDLVQGSGQAGTGTNFILPYHPRARRFQINFDGWQGGAGPMNNINAPGTYSYTLYIRGTSQGGSGTYSIYSASLRLNYNFSNSGNQFLNTTEYFIGQTPGNTPPQTPRCYNFSVTISQLNPQVRSVWVEAGGVAQGSGQGTISTSLTEASAPPNWRNYSIHLGPSLTATNFQVLHNASDTILSSHFPGTHNYTFCVQQTGFNVLLWRARLILTYEYSTMPQMFPVSGVLESSTFDTQITQGAALNSVMVFGNLNGGRVRLQVAASNSPNGPFNFLGPDCQTTSEFEMIPSLPQWIQCDEVHNKRYFRYRLKLCSNDCLTAGNNNPEVQDVILNWSP